VNHPFLSLSNGSGNQVKNREGVLGIAFELRIKIRVINIEGDYAQDIILPIVSERQIYQGVSKKDYVKIRVSSDCTINRQDITTKISINQRD